MGIFSSKGDINSPTALLVKDFIASDVVVIFSKSYCPYCKLAKEVGHWFKYFGCEDKLGVCLFKVFEKIGKKYSAIELDQRNDGDEIQDVLGEMTGARTVSNLHSRVKSIYKQCFLKKFDILSYGKRLLYTPFYLFVTGLLPLGLFSLLWLINNEHIDPVIKKAGFNFKNQTRQNIDQYGGMTCCLNENTKPTTHAKMFPIFRF